MSEAECNQRIFEFSRRSNKRKVEVDFEGGAVSSNGGLILLSEIEKSLGLSKKIASVIPDYVILDFMSVVRNTSGQNLFESRITSRTFLAIGSKFGSLTKEGFWQ